MLLSPQTTDAEKSDLRAERHLQAPTQQVLLERFLKGEMTSDDLVDGLLTDVQTRAAAIEQELAAQAKERAERTREEQEMEANVHNPEPTFLVVKPPVSAPTETAAPAEEAPTTEEEAPTDTHPTATDGLNEVHLEASPSVAAQEVDDPDFLPQEAEEEF